MREKASQLIKSLLCAYGHNISSMAKLINTSNQNLGQKINNGSIRLTDILEICEALKLEIYFRKKDDNQFG